MRLTAEVLGPVRLIADGAPVDLGGPRQRRLLGALVVHRGSVVSTDRLIDAVFDGEPPEAARRTFRTYVARLRRALDVAGVDASGVVVTEAGGYVVPNSAIELDSAQFEEALVDAQDRLTAGDADGAALGLEEALGMWSGSAYGEFADEEWASVEAIRLTALRTVARELRAEAVLESGRHAAVIPDIEALIEEEPFREEPRRLLGLALYRTGRHVDALRAVREYRRSLADETGLEPSRQLDELEQLIVDQDPRLEARPQGRKLRGYVLGSPIAETDLGMTYRATQPSVGREVAITAIPPGLADDATFVRRFEVHAQRIASIEHPNVVPLYDYWREPGAAYLVTRYLAGGSLDRRLSERPLTDVERLSILRDVGAALTAAHGRGITHGQLDAASVLFDDAGTAYLTGFGIETDQRSTPADIAALGQLAMKLWTQSTTTSDQTQASVAIASRVTTIAERAGGSQTDVPVASVAELVAGIESAAAGRTVPTADPKRPTIEGPNPYRGLFAFAESDAEVFFGRERLVEELVVDLATHPFLAVVGPSGSGKSSVVRAGLLPRLRSAGAFVASMVPGERPLAELEIALSTVACRPVPDLADIVADDPSGLGAVLADVLPESGRELILLIDQFEEAFTLAHDAERNLLMRAIVHALDDPAIPLRVILTARADFLGPILDDALVGSLVRDHSRLVAPLDADELHVAIVGPAENAGVAVESALAAALVSDAASSPGSLPLLQYALTELYEHRVEGTMTLDAYHRLGGMGAVLSQRAEEIYSGLDADDRAASRRLFSRLIMPGEGKDDTRRRATQSELAEVSNAVLGGYGKARLIAFDRDPTTREPTVEIAHEALIREWPRLRTWIDEDRDGVRVLRRLTASAVEWEAADGDDSELYRGGRLDAVEEWMTENPGDVNELERAFMNASLAARNAARQHDREQRDREMRSNRRLRGLVAALASVVVIALVAAGLAFVARERADETAAEADLERQRAEETAAEADLERQRADDNAAAAEFQRLTAVATSLAEADRRLAMLVAVEAFDRKVDVESRGALKTALMTEPRFLAQTDTPALTRASPTVAPDGSWIFAGRVAVDSEATEGTWYDTETFEVIGTVRLDERWRLVSSPDRSLVAGIWLRPPGVDSSAGDERLRQVRVHDDEGNLVTVIETAEPPSFVRFDERGRLIVAEPRSISVHLLASDEPEVVIGLDSAEPIIVGDIDSRSSLFAAATSAGETMLVDLDDGELVTATRPSYGRCDRQACRIVFSPDGSLVAFGDASGVIAILDTASWSTVQELAGWAGADSAVAFADEETLLADVGRAVSAVAFVDDETLLVGYENGVISQWDHRTGVRSAVDLDTQTTDVSALAVLGDGRFSTLSFQGDLQRWTSDDAGPFATTLGGGLGITAFAPDSRHAARTNTPEAGMVTVYDLDASTPVAVFAHPASSPLWGVDFSPDGRRLAVGTLNGEIELFDTSSFEPIGLRLEAGGLGPLEFSPDSRYVAVGWNRETPSALEIGALVWDTQSDTVVEVEVTPDFENVANIAWRPDGAAVTFADQGGGDATFDIESGDQIGTRFSVRGQGQAMGVAWEPDGAHLLGSGPFGVSRWDAATGTRGTPIDRESPSQWLAFAPDVNVLATLGTDGRLWTWDLETGSPVGAPIPDQRLGWLFGFIPPLPRISSDGLRLALDGATGTIVWDLDPQRWRDIACEHAGRNMTLDEWARTMGQADYRATCAQWPADAA